MKDSNRPVSRLELIDAIAKLYVINDRPRQTITIGNKPKTPKRNRFNKSGQTSYRIDL